MERIDRSKAVADVMKLLAIPGASGREGAVAAEVASMLRATGIEGLRIAHDKANRKLPFPAQVGNLIARIPGKGARAKARPRLFSSHLDTVAIAEGAKPVRRGGIIRPKGKTALGADCRSGVAALVTLARTVAKTSADHPPLVLLFTIAEEVGLWGSRHVDRKVISACEAGFNFDGGRIAHLTVGAPSSATFDVSIEGKAAHAGINPEMGVSAAAVFAVALADLVKGGWHGAVAKGSRRGTSNIGRVEGVGPTNIVMAELAARGEARSHSGPFLDRILKEYEKAFARAAKSLGAKAAFSVSRSYNAFELPPEAPSVKMAVEALAGLGIEAKLQKPFGGLDANWLNEYGLPTVTLGTGMRDVHQIGETLVVDEYLAACEAATALALM